ncbi:Flp pilus assembly protein CpaB [Paenibacillus solani]|uniref:Flp pilus assembly protein CpaB n=1 Tax=Paenibacillus solani TaxID=1705565 RepID=UPI003D272D1C
MKKLWNRYTRVLLMLIVALALAGTAVKLNQNAISNQVETERIIVVKEDIEPYMEITKENLEFKTVVKSEIPEGAIRNQEEIKFGDAFASQYGFLKGAPLQSTYITTAAKSKFGTAVSLDNGMLQIGVKVDLTTSTGGEVRPGLLVNAFAYVQDEESGGYRSITDKLLEELKVVKTLNSEGTSPDAESGGSLIPSVVVLEVTPEQGEKLMSFQESGKVYLLPAGLAK